MLNRLNDTSLRDLPAHIGRPRYDRSRIATGIVHFGPGAFHRAHQVWFIEKLLANDPRWGICGVSLRSAEVRNALAEQDALYTLAVRDREISYHVLGAMRELLVAPEDPEAVLQRLCAPTTHVVTITVTEKGYCLAGDGSLDLSHPDIRHDLQNARAPASVVGFLAEALRRRRAAQLAPFSVVSCDNLADNGRKLARATVQLASEHDPQLARWIESEVPFPRTMVDSITPATTDELKTSVQHALGLEDRWPVQREAFVQWVIEGGFRGPMPDWAAAGATVTHDVGGYERAKLRLLNAAHSTLAYTGLLSGYRTVAQAMADAALRTTVERLMTDDILPTLTAPADLDLHAYIRAILERFCNPNMHHELAQIAMDGTQKLPIRVLSTVRDALQTGRPVDRLCVPIAAWMRFVCHTARRGGKLNDPLAARLIGIGSSCTGKGTHDVPAFLALEAMFSAELRGDERFTQALVRAYDRFDAPARAQDAPT